MTDTNREPGRPRAIPESRLARLGGLGRLATGIAGAAFAEGARRLARGERPHLRDLVLTPGNAARFADRLARMRGAAMKVGQLLSMEAGDMLPADLAPILARLRAQADFMPPKQLRTVLNAAWGADWMRRFRSFDVRPIAAASIGQVHRARTRDGRDLAIKVQYPGIRRSIDSDVDNVAAMIRAAGVIPAGLDIGPLLEAAKAQLHDEADYRAEARQMTRYRELLEDLPGFRVPAVQDDLTTDAVLAMEWADGDTIETAEAAAQDVRNAIAERLLDLTQRELFAFRFVQTDPNFANYLYESGTGTIILLDFGAARPVSADLAGSYRDLLSAGLAQDAGRIGDAAGRIGLISPGMSAQHRELVLEMIGMTLSVLCHDGPFDFGDEAFLARLRDMGSAMATDPTFTHIPPAEVMFLHRKIAGTYLLAHRLRARVDVGALSRRWSEFG